MAGWPPQNNAPWPTPSYYPPWAGAPAPQYDWAAPRWNQNAGHAAYPAQPPVGGLPNVMPEDFSGAPPLPQSPPPPLPPNDATQFARWNADAEEPREWDRNKGRRRGSAAGSRREEDERIAREREIRSRLSAMRDDCVNRRWIGFREKLAAELKRSSIDYAWVRDSLQDMMDIVINALRSAVERRSSDVERLFEIFESAKKQPSAFARFTEMYDTAVRLHETTRTQMPPLPPTPPPGSREQPRSAEKYANTPDGRLRRMKQHQDAGEWLSFKNLVQNEIYEIARHKLKPKEVKEFLTAIDIMPDLGAPATHRQQAIEKLYENRKEFTSMSLALRQVDIMWNSLKSNRDAFRFCTSVEAILHNIPTVGEAEGRKRVMASLSPRDDDEICETSSVLQLTDPTTLARVALPARGAHCSHMRCFDLHTFLLMQGIGRGAAVNAPRTPERAQWACPCCWQPALPSTLVLDGYVQMVLSREGSDVDSVVLNRDGSYSREDEVMPNAAAKRETSLNASAVVALDDSEEEEGARSPSPFPPKLPPHAAPPPAQPAVAPPSMQDGWSVVSTEVAVPPAVDGPRGVKRRTPDTAPPPPPPAKRARQSASSVTASGGSSSGGRGGGGMVIDLTSDDEGPSAPAPTPPRAVPSNAPTPSPPRAPTAPPPPPAITTCTTTSTTSTTVSASTTALSALPALMPELPVGTPPPVPPLPRMTASQDAPCTPSAPPPPLPPPPTPDGAAEGGKRVTRNGDRVSDAIKRANSASLAAAAAASLPAAETNGHAREHSSREKRSVGSGKNSKQDGDSSGRRRSTRADASKDDSREEAAQSSKPRASAKDKDKSGGSRSGRSKTSSGADGGAKESKSANTSLDKSGSADPNGDARRVAPLSVRVPSNIPAPAPAPTKPAPRMVSTTGDAVTNSATATAPRLRSVVVAPTARTGTGSVPAAVHQQLQTIEEEIRNMRQQIEQFERS